MAFAVQDLLAPTGPDAVRARLASGVVFHSPVADYAGRDDVAHLLVAIGRTIEGIRPGREYVAESRSACEFTGDVGGRPVDGVLIQQIDAAGLVEEATLLVRPLAELRAAVARMRELLAADPLPSQR